MDKMKTSSTSPVLLRAALLPLLIVLSALTASCADLGMLAEDFLGETRIVFYGLVQDQHGNPVKGAEVSYGVERFGLPFPRYKNGTVRTGKDGRFRIRDGRGSRMSIKDIRLTGFEYKRNGGRGYEYRAYYTDCFKPDKGRPELFTVRKKEQPGTILLDFNNQITQKTSLGADYRERYWAIDLVKNAQYEPGRRDNQEYFWDLELTWEADQKAREWKLTFWTNGENTGGQAREDVLHEAPADGYAGKFDVALPFSKIPTTMPDGETPTLCLYLRIGPGMYARFDIKACSASPESYVYFEYRYFVNPYGDRSLEPVQPVDTLFDESKHMFGPPAWIEKGTELFFSYEREARKAFESHRLAERPDFEKLIKEGLLVY